MGYVRSGGVGSEYRREGFAFGWRSLYTLACFPVRCSRQSGCREPRTLQHEYPYLCSVLLHGYCGNVT